MNHFLKGLFFLASIHLGKAQISIDSALKTLNTGDIPYKYIHEIENTSFLLLDARTKAEYTVSHLKKAQWIGTKKNEIQSFINNHPIPNLPVVVYCSIGVRSEQVARVLKKAGYPEVYNLYGGIFAWNNANLPLFKNDSTTTAIHGFNKQWSTLLTKGNVVLPKKKK